MKKAAVLFAWWFMASPMEHIVNVIGPLRTNSQCTTIKTKVAGIKSSCWNDQRPLGAMMFYFTVSQGPLTLVSGAYPNDATCLDMREKLRQAGLTVSTCWGS